MMGKYCGYSIPPSHVSSSIDVLIQFHSDQDIVGAGFEMEYIPTGSTVIQCNTEYYGDYYTEFWDYSKALRCTFFGEWKNWCSSKFVQLELLNKAKARRSKNGAA